MESAILCFQVGTLKLYNSFLNACLLRAKITYSLSTFFIVEDELQKMKNGLHSFNVTLLPENVGLYCADFTDEPCLYAFLFCVCISTWVIQIGPSLS